jgi:hypothetical protein
MLLKVIQSQRYVVAICDTELLGKKFEEGKLQIDVKENFFNGDEMNEEEAIRVILKMMREDATFYIVGEQSVNTAIKTGAIVREDVLKIQEIPVALILI